MRTLFLIFLALLGWLLQGTWLHAVEIGGVKPDLLLILVVFTSLLKGPVQGLKIGFLVGLLEDLLSGKFLGIRILTKALTGLLIGLGETKIFKENYLVPVVVLFFSTLVHEILFMLFSKFTGFELPLGTVFWKQILTLAVYHAVIAPFFYVPAYKAYDRWWRSDK